MFDNLKNLYAMKKQAEELQRQMAGEKINGSCGLVNLTINGNQELLDVQINSTELVDPQTVASDFKKAYNVAQKEMKNMLSKRFKGMM